MSPSINSSDEPELYWGLGDALRYLVATKSRRVNVRKLRGL